MKQFSFSNKLENGKKKISTSMQEAINNHLLCRTLSGGKGNGLLGCGGSCHRGTAGVCQDQCFLCHLRSQKEKFIHPNLDIT